MCGICGRFSPAGVDRHQIAAMAQTIAHRGPDDAGLHIEERVGLASRRLSIIDLETGHQPLSNEDGSVWVVFNGEIYNYLELRQELRARGHRFTTSSDTEVIVHLYEEEGESCVERLRGMFAFALWDRNHQKLLLARDPLGQKPLFYARRGDDLLFASEVKAILAVDSAPREVDFESLHHYLSLRFIPPPRTMFRGVSKLPAGHCLTFDNGVARTRRYWHLDFRDKLDLSTDELLEALGERLLGTVRSHLVSDVPVGALLSGGMDSSMIVALMSKSLPAGFPTFSIGVEEQSFNELPFARQVAGRFGTRHVEECVEPGLIALVPKMISHLDEPSDPIAACMFHAAALAADHVKVVLGGDGGDELFAGFDRYLGVSRLNRLGRLPLGIARAILHPLLAVTPERFAYKSLTQKLRWVDRVGGARTAAERYAEATLFFRFSHRQKRELFADPVWRDLEGVDSAAILAREFDHAPAADPIDRMLYTDYVTRLPEHTLMLTDRMSMAHGLEVRAPFVDHELVQFLASFPIDLKIRRGELKYALRRLAADHLPAEIVRRPKQGFMFPVAAWFADPLYGFVRRFLGESRAVEEGVFNRAAVLRLIDRHHERKVDNHVRIWQLLNFEIWYRMYLEGEEADVLRDEIAAQAGVVRSTVAAT